MPSRKNTRERSTSTNSKSAHALPGVSDWRTTDEDEIQRRRVRAEEESFRIRNLQPEHGCFSTYQVRSASDMTYSVEIRSLEHRQNHCTCLDHQTNGLSTCKHVEAVLLYLGRRKDKPTRQQAKAGSNRVEILVDRERQTLSLRCSHDNVPPVLEEWFDSQGLLQGGEPREAFHALTLLTERYPRIRVSQEIGPWLVARQQAEERVHLRREYETRVQSGEWPEHETLHPLFPYQRDGMLHLAFSERAMLADEMGLGKTIQAIAACALLHRLGKARRVLVVTPASLKTEWEEQIQRFTPLGQRIVYGPREERVAHYGSPEFFTLVNYEQMIRDALDVNEHLKPDVVVLDEAQRIKNWDTQTARAVKRLKSRYAFVLTGTPIENRIDELHSLMSFLDPSALGPLFRFNRDFYQLDDRGKPKGYKNLSLLHERTKPFILRRLKAQVETQLPDRTQRNLFVPLSATQRTRYEDHEAQVARLTAIAERRPLTQQEQDKLMREMAMMRMVCDTVYILNPEDRACPKLGELEKILEECRENPEVKVIVFSEWERMLELVRELCGKLKMGFAWHTGSVPQRRRRGEILAFKNDPKCRVFLSTDSGSTGLNLQCASVVINCDLPWNPAKLEQRIARAWRKNQTRSVSVFNLVSEETIEHRMLGTLAQKQALASGVLDLQGDLNEVQLQGGRQAFLSKLKQLVTPAKELRETPPKLPTDRALAFAIAAHDRLKESMISCEEQYPANGAHSVIYMVVSHDAAVWQPILAALHQKYFGSGVSDPLSPTQLQVVDRAAHETLQRLIEAGVIQSAARISRPLHPNAQPPLAAPSLSEEELRRVEENRKLAQRKSLVAKLLVDGGLMDEARPALDEALLAFATARAIENRKPAPSDLEAVFATPSCLNHDEIWSAAQTLRSRPGNLSTVQTFLSALNSALPSPGKDRPF